MELQNIVEAVGIPAAGREVKALFIYLDTDPDDFELPACSRCVFPQRVG